MKKPSTAETQLIGNWIGRTVDLINDREDWEDWQDDLIQEGWMIALSAYPSFEPEKGSLQTWIVMHLRRDLVRWLENERAHRDGHENIQDFVEVDFVPDELVDDSIEQLIQDRLDLSNLVDKLSEREGIVVKMIYFEDMSEREVGEELGISRSMVQKIHRRAVAKLQQLAGYQKDS